MSFCCEPMAIFIENPYCPLKYKSWTREYNLTVPQYYLKKNEVCISFSITYCPLCGTKLPTDLTNKWFKIIKKEFKITDIWDDEQMKKLPPEFKTDEWWKKGTLKTK